MTNISLQKIPQCFGCGCYFPFLEGDVCGGCAAEGFTTATEATSNTSKNDTTGGVYLMDLFCNTDASCVVSQIQKLSLHHAQQASSLRVKKGLNKSLTAAAMALADSRAKAAQAQANKAVFQVQIHIWKCAQGATSAKKVCRQC